MKIMYPQLAHLLIYYLNMALYRALGSPVTIVVLYFHITSAWGILVYQIAIHLLFIGSQTRTSQKLVNIITRRV